jgi:hypothetical protein
VHQSTHLARATGAAAVCVTLAYVAAVPLADLANAPAADASSGAIAASLLDHRSGVLVALVLNTLAWCMLMPAAFAGLRALAGPKAGLAGTVGLAAAVVEASVIGVAMVFEGAAALGAPRLSAGEVAALHDGYLWGVAASAWPTVLSAGAFAVVISRTRVLPRWTAGVAVAVAAAHVFAGMSVTDSGVLSATGPFTLLAPSLAAIWLTAIGVSLLRTPAAVTTSAAPAGLRSAA